MINRVAIELSHRTHDNGIMVINRKCQMGSLNGNWFMNRDVSKELTTDQFLKVARLTLLMAINCSDFIVRAPR